MHRFLAQLCLQNHLTEENLAPAPLHFNSYLNQIQVLLDENIPVVSFTFDILGDDCIKAFRDKGVILIGTATSQKEAVLLAEKDIAIITAQGIEAGGHRGTFLENEPLPLIGSFSLIPQVVSSTNRPILAAGGIHNGKTIRAAFMLGAHGVQVGSAFIASPESLASVSYKTRIQNAAETEIVLTKSFSGRWARGVRNKFIAEVERSGLPIPAYPIQTSLTGPIRSIAQKQDNSDFMALWAGQSSAKAEFKSAADILKQLIQQTEAIN
ncbi:NAD(P)H-dependent flavin oxidoreductase [Adhaeribacter pallidiroseus]|uniref:Propionate 3-nitronate monooxygenase n=1 Tax=Adhaeribacter pallidiroseus TaxID=2072847 RepID=A0A369QKN1_9BACT|nr:nitronate monooxygenase family protein [Adhaeribacter pallidiroseus]RDC64205.1 Nitronate monooxygenase [Adhaeribacter pallidiroseus]